MLISKWGNSLALRLPKKVVEALNLKEGDDVDIFENGVGSFRVERKMGRNEALSNLMSMRNLMPDGFVFDREKVNERKLY
ncbi:AbrB/MazE/SpoVT family DNA-binding domain-containing protein [Gluconacetobacter entanii]|uniref:AbrB/MazE/SpoVT family DNA-binding domain-containing protein n=2 Tax=Komagataeibacter TaxID=1434011 RepID=A0A850P724_9PROT|nr:MULTISPECIES: AbrB/MazE/SpoVT family DNA-binding domain-containing protein [Acetobacteraceae]KPH88766.1 hypothetical protein GLUCOINTEAF2_0203686 [Komagataeibacter intermedius AF2]MBY4639776.1 AbrB/MazE/SpoVT family DNA-binding domain-containing protein [Gluconacetobacter entanii]MCW4579492.1 AbrB/MazE/SpoVT family DNA-binding domain-containing protein [Gluconacetobacter entanii]MCW4582855.1 AbrB/MazE/SpoVT family DNA-binding domain-containing protein [Gluconacetobacter entanii]MCW4586293.1